MKVPLKVFSEEGSIESQCLEQMQRVCELPFLHHHVALMPDGHWGMGSSIGAVVATKGVVIPALVGVDQGCGLIAVKTDIVDIDQPTLKQILGEVRKTIPVGNGKSGSHRELQRFGYMPSPIEAWCTITESIVMQEYPKAGHQLGSLGGGNHFIEFQTDSEGYLWVMIHSGSRNLGYKVANHYIKLAKKLNIKWHSAVPEKYNLAFLPLDSESGRAYLAEMNYCLEFALANRRLMMLRVLDAVHTQVRNFDFGKYINIHHNYATMENHFGTNVMVHRKGATLARGNTVGIIPGSQGTFSYIVNGRDNRDSFNSCSHGAGRVMGRKAAKVQLDLETEQKRLDDLGILHSVRTVEDLDEAPGAYKDIATVMENQKDLVEIVTKLKPLAVIKG